MHAGDEINHINIRAQTIDPPKTKRKETMKTRENFIDLKIGCVEISLQSMTGIFYIVQWRRLIKKVREVYNLNFPCTMPW